MRIKFSGPEGRKAAIRFEHYGVTLKPGTEAEVPDELGKNLIGQGFAVQVGGGGGERSRAASSVSTREQGKSE